MRASSGDAPVARSEMRLVSVTTGALTRSSSSAGVSCTAGARPAEASVRKPVLVIRLEYVLARLADASSWSFWDEACAADELTRSSSDAS